MQHSSPGFCQGYSHIELRIDDAFSTAASRREVAFGIGVLKVGAHRRQFLHFPAAPFGIEEPREVERNDETETEITCEVDCSNGGIWTAVQFDELRCAVMRTTSICGRNGMKGFPHLEATSTPVFLRRDSALLPTCDSIYSTSSWV